MNKEVIKEDVEMRYLNLKMAEFGKTETRIRKISLQKAWVSKDMEIRRGK